MATLEVSPQLSRGEAHLHLCLPGTQHDADLELARSVLDEREREQAARFRYAEHQRLYTAAHGLLRLVLARYTARPARELEFVYGPHGRPELADFGYTHDLRFSLSHTRGLAGCAVTRVDGIGFDLEAARDIEHLEIAEHYFSEAERRALCAAPNDGRAAYFYRVWTLKEAYLKARGFGLALPLTSFAVEPLAAPNARLVQQPADDTAHWTLRSWADGNHFAALAVEATTPLQVTSYAPLRLQDLAAAGEEATR